MKHGGRRRGGAGEGGSAAGACVGSDRSGTGRGLSAIHFSPSLSFLHSFSGFCWQNVKDTESYIQPYWKSRWDANSARTRNKYAFPP